MPPDIRTLANQILRDPKVVKVGSSEPIATVAPALYPTPMHRKGALVVKILRQLDAGSVLIFTRTKHRTKKLAEELSRQGFKTTSLQGNLSPGRRREAMIGFRNGEYQIMVATDIAARGIDISSITHVIKFDMPNTVDAYTHRIGRTGRAARNGDALTFVTSEDESMVRSIERTLRCTLERKRIEGFDYGAADPKPASGPSGFRGRSGGGTRDRNRRAPRNEGRDSFRGSSGPRRGGSRQGSFSQAAN